MAGDQDIGAAIAERVRAAADAREALRIVGGASKDFFGRAAAGTPLELGAHRGIVSYAPTELVLTARAGTPLAEVESALAEHGQMLPFEPPHLGETATLGGTVACGLSGPRRPYAGAARDFVLGVRVVNGRGEVLRFGGEVMKNVAGYDVSRLMCGALGTLGVLLEISLKVLPRPAAETTLVFDMGPGEAIQRMNEWAGKPLPLSATCHDGERLHVRLSGTPGGIESARRKLGGDVLDEPGFWTAVREQRHPFLMPARTLWRLSVPPTAANLDPGQPCLIEWGGAQRWQHCQGTAEEIRAQVHALGGHATLFRGGDRSGQVFDAPGAAVMALHRRLKQAFDPAGVLNPGRLYENL